MLWIHNVTKAFVEWHSNYLQVFLFFTKFSTDIRWREEGKFKTVSMSSKGQLYVWKSNRDDNKVLDRLIGEMQWYPILVNFEIFHLTECIIWGCVEFIN